MARDVTERTFAVDVVERSREVPVKVDVDANPGLQAAFGVRGIPAVKAFRDGAVVAEFTGSLPRSAVDRWLDGLLPSPADQLAAAGDEASLRQAVASDPGHATARVTLGRILVAR